MQRSVETHTSKLTQQAYCICTLQIYTVNALALEHAIN